MQDFLNGAYRRYQNLGAMVLQDILEVRLQEYHGEDWKEAMCQHMKDSQKIKDNFNYRNHLDYLNGQGENSNKVEIARWDITMCCYVLTVDPVYKDKLLRNKAEVRMTNRLRVNRNEGSHGVNTDEIEETRDNLQYYLDSIKTLSEALKQFGEIKPTTRKKVEEFMTAATNSGGGSAVDPMIKARALLRDGDGSKGVAYMLELATHDGNSDAMFMLSEVYRTAGIPCVQHEDLGQAKRWIKKAISMGNASAKEVLNEIEKAEKLVESSKTTKDYKVFLQLIEKREEGLYFSNQPELILPLYAEVKKLGYPVNIDAKCDELCDQMSKEVVINLLTKLLRKNFVYAVKKLMTLDKIELLYDTLYSSKKFQEENPDVCQEIKKQLAARNINDTYMVRNYQNKYAAGQIQQTFSEKLNHVQTCKNSLKKYNENLTVQDENILKDMIQKSNAELKKLDKIKEEMNEWKADNILSNQEQKVQSKRNQIYVDKRNIEQYLQDIFLIKIEDAIGMPTYTKKLERYEKEVLSKDKRQLGLLLKNCKKDCDQIESIERSMNNSKLYPYYLNLISEKKKELVQNRRQIENYLNVIILPDIRNRMKKAQTYTEQIEKYQDRVVPTDIEDLRTLLTNCKSEIKKNNAIQKVIREISDKKIKSDELSQFGQKQKELHENKQKIESYLNRASKWESKYRAIINLQREKQRNLKGEADLSVVSEIEEDLRYIEQNPKEYGEYTRAEIEQYYRECLALKDELTRKIEEEKKEETRYRTRKKELEEEEKKRKIEERRKKDEAYQKELKAATRKSHRVELKKPLIVLVIVIFVSICIHCFNMFEKSDELNVADILPSLTETSGDSEISEAYMEEMSSYMETGDYEGFYEYVIYNELYYGEDTDVFTEEAIALEDTYRTEVVQAVREQVYEVYSIEEAICYEDFIYVTEEGSIATSEMYSNYLALNDVFGKVSQVVMRYNVNSGSGITVLDDDGRVYDIGDLSSSAGFSSSKLDYTLLAENVVQIKASGESTFAQSEDMKWFVVDGWGAGDDGDDWNSVEDVIGSELVRMKNGAYEQLKWRTGTVSTVGELLISDDIVVTSYCLLENVIVLVLDDGGLLCTTYIENYKDNEAYITAMNQAMESLEGKVVDVMECAEECVVLLDDGTVWALNGNYEEAWYLCSNSVNLCGTYWAPGYNLDWTDDDAGTAFRSDGVAIPVERYIDTDERSDTSEGYTSWLDEIVDSSGNGCILLSGIVMKTYGSISANESDWNIAVIDNAVCAIDDERIQDIIGW